jgi:hypothetical protein
MKEAIVLEWRGALCFPCICLLCVLFDLGVGRLVLNFSCFVVRQRISCWAEPSQALPVSTTACEKLMVHLTTVLEYVFPSLPRKAAPFTACLQSFVGRMLLGMSE